jgi:hypothetical protein
MTEPLMLPSQAPLAMLHVGFQVTTTAAQNAAMTPAPSRNRDLMP